MNRRSFISKAFAGIAAIPLLGKLVKSQPTEWHPSMIRGCVYWDGVNYGVEGSPVGHWITGPHGGMFNRSLTQDELQQVHTYLSRKYGCDIPSWERLQEHYEAAKQIVASASS